MNNTPKIIPLSWIQENITLRKELIGVVEESYVILSKKEIEIPNIQQIPITAAQAQVCVKSAYYPKLPYYVVKIAGNFPNNRQYHTNTSQGCMCVFASDTGKLDTIIADDGLLTQLRTAASGALCAKYLAPKNVKKISIIGAGKQAKLQLKALKLVCNFTEVAIYSRTFNRSLTLASWVKDTYAIQSNAMHTAESAVKNADVIITTTSATEPILHAHMLSNDKPVLVIAMGADSPIKNELSPDLFAKASRFICDLQSQSLALGELRTVVANGIKNLSKVEELSNICLKQKGRQSTDKLIICDLTGVGTLDLGIALYTKKSFDISTFSRT